MSSSLVGRCFHHAHCQQHLVVGVCSSAALNCLRCRQLQAVSSCAYAAFCSSPRSSQLLSACKPAQHRQADKQSHIHGCCEMVYVGGWDVQNTRPCCPNNLALVSLHSLAGCMQRWTLMPSHSTTQMATLSAHHMTTPTQSSSTVPQRRTLQVHPPSSSNDGATAGTPSLPQTPSTAHQLSPTGQAMSSMWATRCWVTSPSQQQQLSSAASTQMPVRHGQDTPR